MPDSLRRVSWPAKGYRPEQVDAFIAQVAAGGLSAEQVRTAGFDLVRGGYDVEVVDARLDVLEDELAGAERRSARVRLGEQGYAGQLTSRAQALRSRLARQHGDRFPRAARLATGYDVADVDALLDQVGDFLDGHHPLTVEAVRTAVFAVRRGSRAYAEQPVDAFLDRVVAVVGQIR